MRACGYKLGDMRVAFLPQHASCPRSPPLTRHSLSSPHHPHPMPVPHAPSYPMAPYTLCPPYPIPPCPESPFCRSTHRTRPLHLVSSSMPRGSTMSWQSRTKIPSRFVLIARFFFDPPWPTLFYKRLPIWNSSRLQKQCYLYYLV